MSPRKMNIALLGGMMLLAGTPWAWAAEQDKKHAEASFDQTPVPSDQLADQRGGADSTNNTLTTITQTNNLNGTVDHNSATNVVSGSNNITGGAFQGSHGFPMVIQNSGSNVLIQNSTILNVEIK
ncbi:MAG: hypothetical protein ABIP64_04920 [Burkholderiales bacterium]